jgi:hypothetical protein
LPDLVHSVKILDANGNVNVFSKDVNPVEFSAATVNLGLLGIIYSYTLRVEPMFKLRVVRLISHSRLARPRISIEQCFLSFLPVYTY